MLDFEFLPVQLSGKSFTQKRWADLQQAEGTCTRGPACMDLTVDTNDARRAYQRRFGISLWAYTINADPGTA